MADLTTRSRHAPALLDAGERGLSADAMPGSQALERTHPPRLLAPGPDVAQGPVATPSMGPTRTKEDGVHSLARTVASAPEGTRWPVVADHLPRHPSAGLGRLVAAHERRPDHLGHQGPRGMRRSLRTRAAFLADPTHRLVLPLHPAPGVVDAPPCAVVQSVGAETPQACLFPLRGGFASPRVRFCGVWPCHDGHTFALDLWAETTPGLQGMLFLPGCTRSSPFVHWSHLNRKLY